jgi:hypothetical protein
VSQVEKNKDVSDDDISECDKQERWAKADTFAVMKEGRKTSIKNFDNEEDAKKMVDELGEKHYVQTRPGTDKKCTGYCNVCKFCSYYKEHYGQSEEKAE